MQWSGLFAGDIIMIMKKGDTKESMLSLLQKNSGGYISGEQLAGELGVSRAYVWKVIKSLQEDGYEIKSVHGRGYSLGTGDRLVKQAVEEYLGPGWNVLLYDEIDSTNDELKRLAEKGAPVRTLVMARRQTAGKGRKGRSFYSPLDTGVYFSVLIGRDCPFGASDMVTPRAAVAVDMAVRELCGIESGIKWVNDIYIGSKKVCGILSEAALSMESSQIRYMLVGIGINISTDDFPEEIESKAASLGKTDVNRLVARVSELLMSLSDGEVLEIYRAHSCVIGREIEIAETGRTAKAVGINDSGNLMVEYPDGEKDVLISGDISIKVI